MVNLCAEGASQGIGRKVPKGSLGPVDILKYSLRVIFRAHAQIFLIFFIPDGRKFVDFHVLFDHHFLNFIAYQHMKGIGKLVCLCSDESRNRLIDRCNKGIQAHAL